MSKALVLGNGKMLVGLDRYAQVRDLYYPHVGQENHVSGSYLHRIGVFSSGKLEWFSDENWDIHVSIEEESFTSKVTATNESKGLTINLSDTVLHENDIFLRRARVKNTSGTDTEVKIFFHHEFEIRETARGDTAFYDPVYQAVIHYRGRRVFLMSLATPEEGNVLDDYTTGIFGVEGKEGSFRDAEDGELSNNPIEHGHADSVIAKKLSLAAGEEKELWYWILADETLEGARGKHHELVVKSPDTFFQSNTNYWKSWTKAHKISFGNLSPEIERHYYHSLLLMKAHVDHAGGVLASSDSDMLNYGRDTYNYVWPRDASRIVLALLQAGDPEPAERFFNFIKDVVEEDGYVLHKYRPDRSLGSSWHPWVQDGKPALPIQEDETALVLISLLEYFDKTSNFDLIDELYKPLVRKMGYFLLGYRGKDTLLPLPSYDLWEERYGVHAFTCATVAKGLECAAKLSEIVGKKSEEVAFRKGADEVKKGIKEYFFNVDGEYFHRTLKKSGAEISYDSTVDVSSIFGMVEYGIYEPRDKKINLALKSLEEKLSCHTSVGGCPRYVGDIYRLIHDDVPGNPWMVTTLWVAEIAIKRAVKREDLKDVESWLEWAVKNSNESGVMPEQIDPHSGMALSASPLTWSHAEFVITVLAYLEKLEEFGGR